MNEDRLKTLFQSWLDGTATSAERDEFLWMVADARNREWVQAHIGDVLSGDPAEMQRMPTEATERLLEAIYREDARMFEKVEPRRRAAVWWKYAVAAAVAGVLAWGIWEYRQRDESGPVPGVKTVADIQDVQPGGDKALLTLSDGSAITLDSVANGTVAHQGETKIVKTGTGQLSVKDGGKGVDVSYNTLSTARGGQYRLVLPDGSKVWLNAASSLRFPTAFSGGERTVELLKGEAYFEVVQDARQPFAVRVAGGSRVQVLGTSFNVNAYEDEDAIRTTLIEGSVQIAAGAQRRLLRPGEQSRMENGKDDINVATVNTRQVVAWKEGYFRYEKTDLRTIMRQLSRWYDIDVKYEGNVSNETFDGAMRRNNPLSKVLTMLENGGVRYRLAGKTLTIEQSPN